MQLPATERPTLDGFALCRTEELLEWVEPFVPMGLTSRVFAARLAALATRLPAAVSVAAFECRLERGASQLDFEVCIRAAGGGRAALSKGLDDLEGAVPRGDPGWRRALTFLREWTDPASLLFDGIPVIWLEFDVDAGTSTPAPFVVATLESGRPHATAAAIDPVVERVLTILVGREIDAATKDTLARALRELPVGGRFVHLALRPAVDGDILRIIVKLAAEDVSGYLARIGWPGSPEDLDAWLGPSCRATPTPSINLDLGATVGPRVGIEYYFDGAPAIDPRWRNVFDLLEAAGACSRERRAQLEAWPSAADAKPCTTLLRVDRELLIKVVYEPGAPLRAKAYLPFSARLNLG